MMTNTIRNGDDQLDQVLAQFGVALAEEFDLLVGGHVRHLQRREAVELGGVDAEGAAELAAAIDRRDELDVVGDQDELVVDRIEDLAGRVQRWHEGVAGALLAAVELVEKYEITTSRFLRRLQQGTEHFRLDEFRHRLPSWGGPHLNGRQEVRRLDHGAAVEEDELHAERVRDGTSQQRLAATLRAVEQNVQPALQQHLQFLRDDGVEIDALDLERLRFEELDLDGAAVAALRFANGRDADAARDARANARIV